MGVTLPGIGTTTSLAERIADTLADTAIADGDRCTWPAASVDISGGTRRIVHRTGEPSVYEGDAGVAWALAQAGAALDRSDLRELARAGALGAVRRASTMQGEGLYDGRCGVGIAAFEVGVAVGDSELGRRGLELLDQGTSAPLSSHDIVGGNAGAVLALVAAYDETRDERWLERAGELGGILVRAADRRPWGWSWPTGHGGEPGLCGLAHGACGIAWALGELEARADPGHGRAVAEALRYERGWFDRRRSNWPDLRAGTQAAAGGRSFTTWWCHGAVGAGLARLRLHDLGRTEPILLAEAGAALQSSFADAAASIDDGRLLHYGLTVCHGLGGTIELLLSAQSALGEDEHLATARWLIERAVEVLGNDVERWPDGVGGPGGSPGLMTGMAGTLVVLLRAAGLASPPSVAVFPGHVPRTPA